MGFHRLHIYVLTAALRSLPCRRSASVCMRHWGPGTNPDPASTQGADF